MLVLTRKEGQVIRVNDDVSIMVVSIREDRVRIGIDAPKETIIHRQEVYEQIQAEKRRVS